MYRESTVLFWVGAGSLQGVGGRERHQPQLPGDPGTVHSTDRSNSTSLTWAPYLSSCSPLTCSSSSVPCPGGWHHHPSWLTRLCRTGPGFSSHSALLHTLCPTRTEIFIVPVRCHLFCCPALSQVLFLQPKIPSLPGPAAYLSRSAFCSSLHPHRTCAPLPPSPPQVDSTASFVSAVPYLALFLPYLQYLMHIL